VIERICSGEVRRTHTDIPNHIAYVDFVHFIIAEEDKLNPRSIDYWFRILDTDGDGILSTYEIEYFFQEQANRIRSISHENITFADFICQLSDMIKPEKAGQFTVRDLRNNKLTPVFFNMIFNLAKFVQFEQRDPYLIGGERNTPEMSNWDRFATAEYLRYAEEDLNGL